MNGKTTRGTAKITIDGHVVEVEAPQPFSVVTSLAQEEGLSKVVIYVDGQPLGKEEDDPEQLTPGMDVVVRRDDGGAA